MLGWDGELPAPGVRTIGEMRPVLADPSCACSAPLYFMYRDLARSDADWHWLHSHNLRYDLTIIPPRDLCGEWVKTKGHYHPKNPAGVGYPEIYEVLEGEAHYLLQSRPLKDVVLQTALKGDVVIIPPGYGHITINPSKDLPLSMANLVSTAFESEYGEYESNHGAAYYELTSGQLRRNPHYPSAPDVRILSPKNGRGDHRICKGPLYSLIGNRSAVEFLNFPEKYLPVFEVLLKD
ncbi:glucose-6-phosphate isomerase family protein [Methanoregula sp.]|uniref:glucose-6-phosphate isomerase family protein n=1 Tax=Methanoregula sp. TaxID=2052170 RepID=UPI00356513B5